MARSNIFLLTLFTAILAVLFTSTRALPHYTNLSNLFSGKKPSAKVFLEALSVHLGDNSASINVNNHESLWEKFIDSLNDSPVDILVEDKKVKREYEIEALPSKKHYKITVERLEDKEYGRAYQLTTEHLNSDHKPWSYVIVVPFEKDGGEAAEFFDLLSDEQKESKENVDFDFPELTKEIENKFFEAIQELDLFEIETVSNEKRSLFGGGHHHKKEFRFAVLPAYKIYKLIVQRLPPNIHGRVFKLNVIPEDEEEKEREYTFIVPFNQKDCVRD
ncbi:hypothetical protein G9A89_010224 [Geosiphon pyriformis]|nr:hypothetical protein G9A89_010224 [Geosiphon pyriformis]